MSITVSNANSSKISSQNSERSLPKFIEKPNVETKYLLNSTKNQYEYDYGFQNYSVPSAITPLQR